MRLTLIWLLRKLPGFITYEEEVWDAGFYIGYREALEDRKVFWHAGQIEKALADYKARTFVR